MSLMGGRLLARSIRGVLAAGALLLVVGGGIVAGVHEHHASEDSTGCAVCALATMSSDVAPIAPVIARPVPYRIAAPALPSRYETRAKWSALGSRAPPIG